MSGRDQPVEPDGAVGSVRVGELKDRDRPLGQIGPRGEVGSQLFGVLAAIF